VLFDEVTFEDQSFQLGRNRNPFNVPDLADHPLDPTPVFGARLEITPDTVPKIDGFSNIENRRTFVAINIATWLSR
jgi:hypothetical protein